MTKVSLVRNVCGVIPFVDRLSPHVHVFVLFQDEAAKQLYGFGAELVTEIGFLTDLEALIVPGFHFATTSIPTQIGRLTNLVDLNLGTLPCFPAGCEFPSMNGL